MRLTQISPNGYNLPPDNQQMTTFVSRNHSFNNSFLSLESDDKGHELWNQKSWVHNLVPGLSPAATEFPPPENVEIK